MLDLDATIGHYARTGIWNATDLGEYYRRFIAISRYLISMRRLSTQEESRSFFRGMQPRLEEKVRKRLEQKFVDQCPDDPFELNDIFEAVSYVLMGSAMLGPAHQASGTSHNASAGTCHRHPGQSCRERSVDWGKFQNRSDCYSLFLV